MNTNKLEKEAEGFWKKFFKSKWFWIVLVLIVLIVIVRLMTVGASAQTRAYYNKTTDVTAVAAMDRDISVVKDLLVDPDTAKFRSVYHTYGENGAPVTCGEVNAKNTAGAYTGYRRFVSSTSVGAVVERSPGGDPDFADIWNALC